MWRMSHVTGYVIVFFGAGIGGMLRHAVNRLSLGSSTFPWATLAVNVTGSLAMGVIAGWFAFRSGVGGQSLPLFLTTGILGGYTTFSAFSLDAALLWLRGDIRGAVLYVMGSFVLSLAAMFLGLTAMRP